MSDESKSDESRSPNPRGDEAPTADSLENTDSAESLRQLWWTIGVTVVGLVVLSFFYF
tara:strand:+ start:1926 stop:2099 length:174 start_codon:yes stop_codon:yes gene_type:complete